MIQGKRGFARLSIVAGAVVLGGFSLSACATTEYVDQRIAEVNTHLSAVDAKADQALSAAQAAQAAAAQANQRIDALTATVSSLQAAPPPPPGRVPRG